MDHVRYISFSSSGLHGFLFEGFLQAFEDSAAYEPVMHRVRGISGTSGGSIAALTLALSVDRETRMNLLSEMSSLGNIVCKPDVTLMIDRFGLDDGVALRQVVEQILIAGGLSATSKMKDLRRLLRRDVVFVAHNLNTGRPVNLSAETVPDMSVADAVFASCCIPFVFAPLVYRDASYCDGVLSAYLPHASDDAETMHVVIPPATRVDAIGSWTDFLRCLMLATTAPQQERLDRVMALPTTVRLSHPRVDHLDTTQITWTMAKEMIRCGYELGMLRLTPAATAFVSLACAVYRVQELTQTRSEALPASEGESEDDLIDG